VTEETEMHRKPSVSVRLGKAFARLVVGSILAVSALLCYVQVAGFPDWARERLLQWLSTPTFSVEADAVSFSIFSGVRAHSARVYRKHVVGPPVLTAERVDVLFAPMTAITAKPRVRRIRIEGGTLCPEMTARQSPGSMDSGDKTCSKEGLAASGETQKMSLELELIDCRLNGLDIKSLHGRLSVDGLRWSVKEVQSSVARGEEKGSLNGEIIYDTTEGVLKGNLAARVHQGLLLYCFNEYKMQGLVKLVRRFDFEGTVPRIEAEFSLELKPGGLFQSKGRIWLQESVYRGVKTEQVDVCVTVRCEGKNLDFSLDPLLVIRPEGKCRASIKWDGEKKDVQFEGTSTMDHKALIGMIGILTNGALNCFDFEGSSSARGSGLVAFRNRLKTNFKVDAESERIRLRKLVAEHGSFTVRMTGATNWIENFSADLNDGRLTGSAAFFFDPVSFTNTGYEVSLDIKDAAFKKFIRMTGASSSGEFDGNLSGSVHVSGPPGSNIFQNMVGSGRISIADDRVFSLPIFGGFSQIMTKIIPGLDLVLRQTDASASFTIADGKIHSDAIHIKGDFLSLVARGDYHFDGELDFSVRVSLMKEHTLVARVIAPLVYPISKLFEFRLRGTIDNPDWYPTSFSKEMLQRIGLVRKDEISD